MDHLLLFTKMTFTRMKNRMLIHLAKRPEVILFFVLLVVILLMSLLTLYTFADTTFEVHIHLFPTMFYTLVLAVIFPYGAFELKRGEPVQEQSIFELMMGHKKFLFLNEMVKFLASSVYTFGLLFLILSRMSNIDLFSSILYWHSVSMFIFTMSIISSKVTLLLIRPFIQSIQLSFMSIYKIGFIVYLLIFLSLPFHQVIARYWLHHSTILSSILLFVVAIAAYLLLQLFEIEQPQSNIKDERANPRILLRQKYTYSAIAMINIHKYIVFIFMLFLFLQLIGIFSNQSLMMLTFFKLFLLMAISSFIFDRLETQHFISLINIRASLLKYTFAVEVFYFLVALLSFMGFTAVTFLFYDYSFTYFLIITEFYFYMFILCLAPILTIILRFLFDEFFGILAKTIGTGVVIMGSYVVIPKVVDNIAKKGSVTLAMIGMIFILLGIQLLLVRNHEINT